MYLDKQTATEQAQAIHDVLGWFEKKIRRLTGKAPEKKTVFLDTETTGLKPGAAEVIEVAAIVETTDGDVRHWSAKIKPQHIETAHPKALEINGYTPEKWADAIEPKTAAQQLVFILKDAVLVGHNVSFDARFLDHLFEECGIDFKATDLEQVDTQALVKTHLKPLGLKSASLVNVCDFFGWDRTQAHTAEADTDNCRKLYHKLIDPTDRQKKKWAKMLK